MNGLLNVLKIQEDSLVTILTMVALGLFFVFLIYFLFIDYKKLKNMEARKMLFKNLQRLQKFEVNTVYSDKAKNVSGTEILPEPVKKPTEKYSFVFVGWDKNHFNDSGDTVAKAVFVKKLNSFIVNFYDDDKTTLLKTVRVKYGDSIDTSEFIPLKQDSKEFSFKFRCWSKETTNITKDDTLYAVYDASPKKYTYTFYDSDGKTILSQKSDIFGAKIRVPAINSDDDNQIFVLVHGLH